MSKLKVKQCLTNAFEFIYSTSTYEIGNVQQLWRYSIETRYNFYQWLVDELCEQVAGFVQQGENGYANQFTDLILLLVDSLIFNLYSRHKSNDKNKIHNSVYQASGISTDYMGIGSGKSDSDPFTGSVALNPTGPNEVGAFIQAIEKLLKNKEFFKNLQKLLSYNDSDQNKLQLSFFINSLEYIVEKEGISEDGFIAYQQNRKYLIEFLVEMQKMANQEEIDEINSILFSRKLFKIKKLLSIKNETVSPREVHFTILRIYFAGYSKKRSNFKRGHFQRITFAGEDIIYSLTKMYITSQTKRDQLFRQTEVGDIILDFIINYLLLLFYPVFCSFQQLFDTHICPHANLKPVEFFQKCDKAIRTYFVPFFDQLPIDLCNFLAQIHYAVKTSPNFSDNVLPSFPITTLFINRFLLNPEIKMLSLGTNNQIDNFLSAANLFKDLFYVNAAKNYVQAPNFLDLSESLRVVFENQITTYEFDRTLDVYSYFITDPLLRNDYNFLYIYMKMLKFTPADQKEVDVDHFDPSILQKRSRATSEVNIASTKEQQMLLRLTGLRVVEELPIDDAQKKSKDIPNYEDYNSKQQQQYIQQHQGPVGQQQQIIIQQPQVIIQQPIIITKPMGKEQATQTLAQQEEVKKKPIIQINISTQVEESMQRKFTPEQEKLVNQQQQEALKPYKTSIQQLKDQLSQQQVEFSKIQDRNDTQLSQIKQQNQLVLQQRDKQINQLQSELSHLQSAHSQLLEQCESQRVTIEDQYEQNNQLHHKVSRTLDEKDLLLEQFSALNDAKQTKFSSHTDTFFTESKMTEYKKQQQSPDDEDYEIINKHLQTRQMEVLKIQGEHEIHRRSIQRKM